MKTISVKNTKEQLNKDKNFFLIDVRESWEHDIGIVEGSIKMPLSRIVQNYVNLKKSRDYAVICHSGVRSLQAGSFLESKGFSVVNVEGGIDRWSVEIDDKIERY